MTEHEKVCDAMGLDPGYSPGGRDMRSVEYRTLMVYLLKGKTDIRGIARAIGRDRTSVYDYLARLEDIEKYPRMFHESVALEKLKGEA